MTGEVGNQAADSSMRLVAVATGKAREVDIQGSKVQTAYLKSAVAGPCFIDYGGPTGNETAVHPAGALPERFRQGIREALEPVELRAETNELAHHCQAGKSRCRLRGVAHEARVLFRRSAKEARWRAIESLTLLNLAQTVGLELPFSCRSGYCQTCQCRIIEGEARYAFAPLCAPAPGHALLCCARPASAVLVLDA
jgi:ferredoxin